MEDYAIDIIIGKGPSARSLRLDIPKFTLIGATTRAGSLSAPLRDRFGVISKFELYSKEDLMKILDRSCGILNVESDAEALEAMAARSRGTPRVANRMLKRVRDFSQVKGDGHIDMEIAQKAFDALGVDALGLEGLDREILKLIIDRFHGGPTSFPAVRSDWTRWPRPSAKKRSPWKMFMSRISYSSACLTGRLRGGPLQTGLILIWV